jgi:hypothetical protein
LKKTEYGGSSKNLKTELPSTTECIPSGIEVAMLKSSLYFRVHCSTTYNTKDTEMTQGPPKDEWSLVMGYVYTISLLKTGNSIIFQNIKEPREHC